jgi:hypothetical protein
MSTQVEGQSRKILRKVSGYACLAVGVAGFVIPILPGTPLVFLGLGLLSVDSPWAARLRDRLRQGIDRQIARLHGKSRQAPPVEAPSRDPAC